MKGRGDAAQTYKQLQLQSSEGNSLLKSFKVNACIIKFFFLSGDTTIVEEPTIASRLKSPLRLVFLSWIPFPVIMSLRGPYFG